MKEKKTKYKRSKRTKKRRDTRCGVGGGQLLNAKEIKNEIHAKCDKDNKNRYLM